MHRAIFVVFGALFLSVAIGVIAVSTAHAADYKLLLCAGNNGSNSFQTATNTASPQSPGGIFDFNNYCGPAPDPAGNSAFLRIAENQAAGNAGESAYGSISWTVPPWVAILAGGGYTREPNAFNDGWRGRFWAEGLDGSTNNILMQGTGQPNSGIFWSPTSTFAPHVWPFSGFGYYRRFVFEMTCVRPAGCDRGNFNAVDANSIALVLADVAPVDLQLTNTTAPFLGGHWVRGNQTATYSWSDQGSGIRMEWIDIDGARRFTIDHASECDTGASGPNGEFARVFQPCPVAAGIGRSNTIDTASLPDGPHALMACAQDYAQWQGLYGTGGASCQQATIRTDNTAPGAPAGLEVTSANPQRYLSSFGARWQLPPNQGSPIAAVHYEVLNAANEVVAPERVLSGENLTSIEHIEGPARASEYRLRLWLEDEVGLQGPAATAPIPHDTTPPAAPQGVSVTSPATSRSAEGFDLSWHDIPDAGAPISAAHYRVMNGAGQVVVPEQTVERIEPQAIADLQAPRQRSRFTLQLWLSDAEGNVGSPVSMPLSYNCVRSDVSDGLRLSASIGPEGKTSVVVAQGSGAELGGRLLAATGGGVANATLCVFSRVITEGEPEFLGLAVTGEDGAYRFAAPAGASRELSVTYRSGHREITAAAQLATTVRPSFGARKKTVHNKGVARFEGWIPGPHNDGVVVVLQVERADGWLAFHRYRTRDDGHFTLSYRFNRTFRPTFYRMRAQVRTQSGYPYLQGTSRPLKLVVLPALGRRS